MLIECKECRKDISDKADSCPQCGVPNPAVSYELERLNRELEELENEESRQADLYMKYYNQFDSFPLNLLRWNRNKQIREKVDHHVALANKAQQDIQAKSDQIYKFERNLSEKRSKK